MRICFVLMLGCRLVIPRYLFIFFFFSLYTSSSPSSLSLYIFFSLYLLIVDGAHQWGTRPYVPWTGIVRPCPTRGRRRRWSPCCPQIRPCRLVGHPRLSVLLYSSPVTTGSEPATSRSPIGWLSESFSNVFVRLVEPQCQFGWLGGLFSVQFLRV